MFFLRTGEIVEDCVRSESALRQHTVQLLKLPLCVTGEKYTFRSSSSGSQIGLKQERQIVLSAPSFLRFTVLGTGYLEDSINQLIRSLINGAAMKKKYLLTATEEHQRS